LRASHLSHSGDLRNALERSPRTRGISWLCKFSVLLSETQGEELTLQILMRIPSKIRECEMRAQMEHKTWTRSEIEPFVVKEGHSPREPTPAISASSVLVVAALQVSYVSCSRQHFYKSREDQENAPPCGM
jgi:hypothetical protein